MHFDLIITRHPGLVEFLTEEGFTADQIIGHVSDPEILEEKHVCGVLPVSFAARCASFTEVNLGSLPPELRGKELTKEDVREHCTGICTYKVLRTKIHTAI